MEEKNIIAKINAIEMQLEILKGSIRKGGKGGGFKSLRGIIKERFSEEEIKEVEVKYKESR